jgi:preprotein translocase subunit SecG
VGLLSIALLVIFVIGALVLVLVILLQDEQGEGIGGLFGGASSTPFGSRSGNVLTRFTAILGAVFLVGAFLLAWLNRTPETQNLVEKARQEQLQQAQQQSWWVERIDTDQQGPQVEQAPASAGSQTLPANAGSQTSPESGQTPASGINR